MLKIIKWIVVGLGLAASAVTLASLSKGSHWFFRAWDFPRVQIAAVAAVSATLFRGLFFRGRLGDWLLLFNNLLCVLWQAFKIFPFTPFARVQVKRSDPSRSREQSFRLLISNVMMENREPERLLALIADCRPDLVLTVETNAAWASALQPLLQDFPHSIQQPQENYYGMMLFSRFPLVLAEVKFLVQHDIPSVHAAFDLPSGDRIFLHGLHPRPPEPIRDQDSTPRDAELVVVGRDIRANGARPTIVAGDLNDVAWSATTELFVRLSGLLDPRVGRGLYNSFHADNVLVRYPLDHVFHSNHFTLTKLQRLPHIGSDHFPVFIELCFDPKAKSQQPKPQADAEDLDDANEKLQKQAEAARTGDDRPKEE
jgi:endonuclease/exonuclease/phosphatase (EEP) superfamily protein YafD